MSLSITSLEKNCVGSVCKNEVNRDENLDMLGTTLTELIKQLYSKKPKEVKAPKLKRITRSESYDITRLGRQYLAFIEEPQ